MFVLLCGFMGSGKSTLVERCKRNDPKLLALDLDHVVAERVGVAPSHVGHWIRTEGIEAFREQERKALAALSEGLAQAPRAMLALGGGALDKRSWPLIEALADKRLVWVDTPFEVCWERISGDPNRPMAAQGKEGARLLYEERLPWYRRADIVLGPQQQARVRVFEDFVTLEG